jgi:hypothetical protein
MLTVDDEIHAILESPTSSYWLRQALHSALERDSVDAANDAEHLSDLLSRRCNLVESQQPNVGQGNCHETNL